MKRFTVTIGCFVLWALLAGAVSARTATIPISEIKPGMKGYGLTVFQGTVPERFDVEVVDVVPNFMLRQNIILIRCSHPVTDKAGVIGGMSGSPIFINGKLAGALAYGWRFSKEALAGVTPIQNMLDITTRKQRGATVQNPFEKLALFKKPLEHAGERFADTFFRRLNRNESTQLVAAKTPLSLSGFSGESWKMIEDTLSPFGLEPMQGGGNGGRTTEGPTRFEDGSAIGVQMIRGDLSATGIGTVTTTHNGQVLAFGHPMFNMGESYLPVTSAKIHTVIASLARSNKLGTPLRELGALVQDRMAGISARTDLRAGMIPVKFHITDERSGFRDTYDVSVAQREWLTARLVHSALVQFVQNACSDVTDVSAQIEGRIKIADRPVLIMKDQGVARRGLQELIGWFRPAAVVQSILANPFEDTQIESMEFDVNLEYGLSFSYIKGMYLTAENPLPGEIVNLHVRLVDYGGRETIVSVPLEIPNDAQDQKIKLTVGGGNDMEPPMPTPETLDDMLANVQRLYPANALVVSMEAPGESLNVRGRVLADLPAFAASALHPNNGDDESKHYRALETKIVPQQTYVSGKHSIQFKTGRRTK
ncbi:MAG: hypothetical protein JXR76_26445 [Deltaproteobacteria bacterium]|nr:hypothetical protein [Deltaproteobacteria bacterium]